MRLFTVVVPCVMLIPTAVYAMPACDAENVGKIQAESKKIVVNALMGAIEGRRAPGFSGSGNGKDNLLDKFVAHQNKLNASAQQVVAVIEATSSQISKGGEREMEVVRSQLVPVLDELRSSTGSAIEIIIEMKVNLRAYQSILSSAMTCLNKASDEAEAKAATIDNEVSRQKLLETANQGRVTVSLIGSGRGLLNEYVDKSFVMLSQLVRSEDMKASAKPSDAGGIYGNFWIFTGHIRSLLETNPTPDTSLGHVKVVDSANLGRSFDVYSQDIAKAHRDIVDHLKAPHGAQVANATNVHFVTASKYIKQFFDHWARGEVAIQKIMTKKGEKSLGSSVWIVKKIGEVVDINGERRRFVVGKDVKFDSVKADGSGYVINYYDDVSGDDVEAVVDRSVFNSLFQVKK